MQKVSALLKLNKSATQRVAIDNQAKRQQFSLEIKSGGAPRPEGRPPVHTQSPQIVHEIVDDMLAGSFYRLAIKKRL
jgi:hypothetical protein